jgi:feruloyl-CoA synthase
MLALARACDDPALRIGFDDGSFVLRSPEPLKPYARCIGEWLERWAAETPDAAAFAERDADGGWRRLTLARAARARSAVAQSLLGLKLPPQAPVVVLSDNAIDHLLLMLAAMHVGRAVCTVSSAYCRLTQDYSKIHGILATLGPALVYASDAAVYGPPLASSGMRRVTVFSRGAETFPGALAFDSLLRTAESPAVMPGLRGHPARRPRQVPADLGLHRPPEGGDQHPPHAVRQPADDGQVWRFLEHEKPVLVDWLPWSHTFGGNHNLNMVLRNGGTLYIDEGPPAPGLVEKTLANLREVQPTLYFNVPRGFDMLLPLLEADEAWRAPSSRAAHGVLRRRRAAAGHLGRLEAWRAACGRATGVVHHLWGSPRPRRPSPARTGSSSAPASSACRCPGAELKFVPNGGSWRCACAASTSSPATATRRT